MKAIVVEAFGGPEVLRLGELPTPEPGVGEVLLRVLAAGVNHVDLDICRGVSGLPVALPHVPGVDAAGEVVAVGPGVRGFAPGDRVAPHFELSCGLCRNCLAGRENICLDFEILGGSVWGSYAEYLKVGAHHLVRIPEGLSPAEAVSSFVPFATAWEALVTVGRIGPGETALIHAAGSGVGSAAIQVARLAGARVLVTAGSPAKLERARELGADVGIDYRQQDVPRAVADATGGRGVDIVLDMVGGRILQQSIEALAPGGRITSVGAHAGEQVEIDMIALFRKHVSIHGCGRSTRAIAAEVLDHVAAGRLRPVIHARFPLAEAAEAHRVMESRDFFGRMVLEP